MIRYQNSMRLVLLNPKDNYAGYIQGCSPVVTPYSENKATVWWTLNQNGIQVSLLSLILVEINAQEYFFKASQTFMLLILIYFPLPLIEPSPSSFLQLICGNLNCLSIYHMHQIEDLLTLFHNVFRILSSIQTSEDLGIHPQELPNPQTSRPFLSSFP